MAALLLTIACTPRQTAAPPRMVAPAPVATHYWFSPTQKERLLQVGKINARRFQPMFVDGREYTECQTTPTPIGRFTDYVLVVSKDSREPGPCGRNSGEWE